jgi:hypothetical protein
VNLIDLEKKILRGKEMFSEIIRLISDFLEKFDDMSPAEIQTFERKRQQLLNNLLNFHAEFRKQFPNEEGDLPLETAKKLEEFRIFQEVFVQIVMDKGEQLITRATDLKERLRREMSVITSGKNALRGYDGKRGFLSGSLNNTA